MPRVWNKHLDDYPAGAAFCGRGSPYGNPYIIGQDGDRDQVCDLFEQNVLPMLDVSALRGKDLLCFCKPKRCHCDPILRKANMLEDDFWDVPDELLEIEPEIVSTGGLAGAIQASMAKWARKPADLYPTPPDCIYSLIPHIEDILPPGSVILEPGCADGQISRALEEFGYEVISTDLRPDVKYGTGGIDFLADDYEAPEGIDAVWTNPPFGAAALFIQRALEIAPVVIMLLKAQYWNTSNRKKLFRETKPWREFKLTWRPAFLAEERGNSPLMDCIWVVWRRGHDGLPTVDILDRLPSCPLPADSYGGL